MREAGVELFRYPSRARRCEVNVGAFQSSRVHGREAALAGDVAVHGDARPGRVPRSWISSGVARSALRVRRSSWMGGCRCRRRALPCSCRVLRVLRGSVSRGARRARQRRGVLGSRGGAENAEEGAGPGCVLRGAERSSPGSTLVNECVSFRWDRGSSPPGSLPGEAGLVLRCHIGAASQHPP